VVTDTAAEERIVDLQMRLALLEDRLNETTRAVATPVEPEVPAEELRTFVASLRSSGDELPPSLKTGVLTALETIRAEEEQARELERQARREDRVDSRIADLATRLGLDREQSTDLRTAMLSIETARETLGRSRDRADRETYRDLRTEYDATLLTIFSPAQYEAYQELRKGDDRDRRDRDSRRDSNSNGEQSRTRNRDRSGS